jgi:hypothetical protein
MRITYQTAYPHHRKTHRRKAKIGIPPHHDMVAPSETASKFTSILNLISRTHYFPFDAEKNQQVQEI